MKTWTKAEALPILQQAYRDNVLAAQNGGTVCAYRGPNGPCIIGVLLDDETAERWDTINDQGSSVSIAAVFHGYEPKVEAKAEVLDVFPSDVKWFADLQAAHDAWISSLTCGMPIEDSVASVERLLELT